MVAEQHQRLVGARERVPLHRELARRWLEVAGLVPAAVLSPGRTLVPLAEGGGVRPLPQARGPVGVGLSCQVGPRLTNSRSERNRLQVVVRSCAAFRHT